MTERDFQMAPCLRNGPLAQPGQALVEASRALGRSPVASVIRAWTVPFLYNGMDKIFASNEDPTPQVVALFERLTGYLRAQANVTWNEMLADSPDTIDTGDEDLESSTAEHFGQLFRDFSTEAFWAQPFAQLRIRLERNDVDLSILKDKKILDAGSGSGRNSFVLKSLGARSVTGIDLSGTSVSTAKERLEHTRMDGIEFQIGSVLELPFSDNSFDIVFSMGVLHATPNWKLGIAEMLRVLRPDGIGLIMYMNENPGGLFWDILEVLRVVMIREDPNRAKASIHLLGIPRERVIGLLDATMAAINDRSYYPEDIERCLREHGAQNIRRFLRGTDTDGIEKVYQKRPYADVKYGIGENRYIFSKRQG